MDFRTIRRSWLAAGPLIFAGSIALFGATTQSAPAPSAHSVAGTFGATMRAWMEKYRVPRGSVAVMREDRLIFAEGYGDRAANERVAIWSLSKAVTALCVASLIQDKKLGFDDPIGSLLGPAFAKYGQPADERLMRVTVAQLLAHRSGLPRTVGNNQFAPGGIELLQRRPLAEATADMLMPSIMKQRLTAEPGAEHQYSNVGYLLLGEVIETVTGAPYETECARRVLAKAGIAQPTLDAKWGRLLTAAAGWALSGPEYLGFVRLLSPRRHGFLTPATQSWLRTPDGKWIDKDIAYTLGVRLRPIPHAGPNIFHAGGWLWHGRYSEKRGTWFVLRNDGVAWFASYDGVHGETDPKAVGELHESLSHAARVVASWPRHDLFAEMGVGPISAGR